MRIIDLAGIWTLEALSPMRSSGIAQGRCWDMSIPGSIHDTLLGNGIIEEPYDGTEMSRTSWIEESAWKAEARFTVAKGNDSFLLSCGSFSPAEIRINGRTAAASASSILIDATDYLPLYGKNAHDFTIRLILDVLEETGITATAGIGENLYLAKIAMDIMAKHIPADENGVRIAELDEMEYRRKLWD